jgi:hypothetical protein
VNVKKTKVVVFEARKFVCQAFQYEGEAIEQLNSFEYLSVELHGTKGMQAQYNGEQCQGKRHFLHCGANAQSCASLTQHYNANYLIH